MKRQAWHVIGGRWQLVELDDGVPEGYMGEASMLGCKPTARIVEQPRAVKFSE